ncbi:MAG TPA: hypothetical protein VHL11_00175, partial [Phototrophicaceae bacterium]|nr:hypothetical protein [Phototrophicaceae bacterium]
MSSVTLQAQETATPTATPIVWTDHYYAPYVYMGGYPTYLLAPTAEATGIRYYTLGFILGSSSKCAAAWMGSIPINQPFNERLLNSDL